jgi:hypothetical protein
LAEEYLLENATFFPAELVDFPIEEVEVVLFLREDEFDALMELFEHGLDVSRVVLVAGVDPALKPLKFLFVADAEGGQLADVALEDGQLLLDAADLVVEVVAGGQPALEPLVVPDHRVGLLVEDLVPVLADRVGLLQRPDHAHMAADYLTAHQQPDALRVVQHYVFGQVRPVRLAQLQAVERALLARDLVEVAGRDGLAHID